MWLRYLSMYAVNKDIYSVVYNYKRDIVSQFFEGID